jgi:hypothetical protein
VAGVFPLYSFLEKLCVGFAICGQSAKHFIGTCAAVCWTGHAFGLLGFLQVPDFSLKFLMAEHISSKGFWHVLTLPQKPETKKCFSSMLQIKPDCGTVKPCRFTAKPNSGSFQSPQGGKRKLIADFPDHFRLSRRETPSSGRF